MSEVCCWCGYPAMDYIDGDIVRRADWDSETLAIATAAQETVWDVAARRAKREARLVEPPPSVILSRLKLYACGRCTRRYRMAQVPIDIQYGEGFLRVGSLYRKKPNGEGV